MTGDVYNSRGRIVARIQTVARHYNYSVSQERQRIHWLE